MLKSSGIYKLDKTSKYIKLIFYILCFRHVSIVFNFTTLVAAEILRLRVYGPRNNLLSKRSPRIKKDMF